MGCRGAKLMHRIDIPQPGADGQIRLNGRTMPVGAKESVQVDTLRLMFRAHYREPPLALPIPASGQEQSYRLLYSPDRGAWQVEKLKCTETDPTAAAAATTTAVTAASAK